MFKKILVLVLLSVSLVNYSFGFTCNNDGTSQDNTKKAPICENTPEVINTVLEDEINVLNMLKGSKKKYEGLKGLGNKTLDTFKGAYQKGEQVFTNFGTDFFANFYILLEEKYIVRDWIKLTNFKEYIAKKTKGIDLDQNIEDLDKIMKEIKQKDTFVLNFNGTTNKEFINYIRTNHQAVEQLYYNMIVKGDQNYEIKLDIGKKGEAFGINKGHLNNLINKFKKAYIVNGTKPSCNQTWDDFIKKVKEVVCKYGKYKTDKALDRFSCNYGRLRNALFGENNNVSNCGTNKIQEFNNNQHININIIGINKVVKQAEDIRDFLTGTIDKITSISDILKGKNVDSNLPVTTEQKPAKIYKNRLINSLTTNSSYILKARDQTTEKFRNIESSRTTHNIPMKIVESSLRNYKARKILDGDGDDYDKSAAGYLTQACLNQSPYVGDCKNSKK